MGKVLKNSWALFAGFAILITAHGFQGNLLGVRSVLEEFGIRIAEQALVYAKHAGRKTVKASDIRLAVAEINKKN